MANIFDYLTWRGDLDFNASPFNPVDNIIFSQLSYLTLDNIVPDFSEKNGITIELALKIYDEKMHGPESTKPTSTFKDDPALIRTLASSKRFGNCHLIGFVNHIDTGMEIQFSALTIHTTNDNYYVAFRGTDASIIGWKENLNMSFKDIIPSQLEAVKYLEKIASMTRGSLCLCGHSKGGNLAIYAASYCKKKVQDRITAIYSNDAPGFHEKIISNTGFLQIKDRIHSYVPQSSVIGMLLEHGYENKVIKSTQSGLMQHELYSWEITYNDLVYLDKTTISSRFVNNTIREWLERFDTSKREQFIEALYHLLSAADVKSVYDLEASWFASSCRIIKSLSHIDLPTRKLIRQILVELFRAAGRNLDTLIKNT